MDVGQRHETPGSETKILLLKIHIFSTWLSLHNEQHDLHAHGSSLCLHSPIGETGTSFCGYCAHSEFVSQQKIKINLMDL